MASSGLDSCRPGFHCFIDQSKVDKEVSCSSFCSVPSRSHGRPELPSQSVAAMCSSFPGHPNSRISIYQEPLQPLVHAPWHQFPVAGRSRRSNFVSKTGRSNSQQEGVICQIASTSSTSWGRIPQKDVCSDASIKDVASEPLNAGKALYGLCIKTSRETRSGLSMPNAGIQIAVIGDNLKTTLIHRIGRVITDNESDRLIECSKSAEISAKGESDQTCAEGDVREEGGNSMFGGFDNWSRKISSNDIVILGSGEGIFERGSEDEIWIVGPHIGPVGALWIAPEAGTWRFEEASLLVVPIPENDFVEKDPLTAATPLDLSMRDSTRSDGTDGMPDSSCPSIIPAGSRAILSDDEGADSSVALGTSYVFRVSEPVLIGDTGEFSALELGPSAREENIPVAYGQQSLLSGMPSPVLLEALGGSKGLKSIATDSRKQQSESMEEYRLLKKWLVQATGSLALGGTLGVAALGGTEEAKAFAFGGVLGFLYILRLQNRVDSIPTTAYRGTEGNSIAEEARVGSVSNEDAGSPLQLFGGSVSRVALGVGAGLVLLKVSSGVESSLSSSILLAALGGFLSHKVAVLLAAFQSFSVESPDDK